MTSELGFIKVGEPFSAGVNWQGVDRFELRCVNGGLMLQVLIPNPSDTNISAFLKGQIFVGLYAKGSTVFFLFKIDGLYDWSDQAFSINLNPPDEREIPPVKEGERQLMSFVLIDSVSGITRGIRVATLSPNYTSLFYRFLRRQLDENLTREQHEENIAAVYAVMDSKSMAKAALLREKAGSRVS